MSRPDPSGSRAPGPGGPGRGAGGPAPGGGFDFSGGALCLDFANTLADRPRGEQESLRGIDDLVAWCEEAGLVARREAGRTIDEARRSPSGARRAFRRAIALRERLYRVFAALAAGTRPDRSDVDALNRDLASALSQLRLESGETGFAWGWSERGGGAARLTWPVVRSAADLLTSDEAGSVRECGSPTCSWLFVDRSRTGRRRWCDMKTCGNRAKARRHYHKARKAKRGPPP